MTSRFRLWLWRMACRSRRVCDAKAYFRLVDGSSYTLRIDDVCRTDSMRNGCCYCGKVEARGALRRSPTLRRDARDA